MPYYFLAFIDNFLAFSFKAPQKCQSRCIAALDLFTCLQTENIQFDHYYHGEQFNTKLEYQKIRGYKISTNKICLKHSFKHYAPLENMTLQHQYIHSQLTTCPSKCQGKTELNIKKNDSPPPALTFSTERNNYMHSQLRLKFSSSISSSKKLPQ